MNESPICIKLTAEEKLVLEQVARSLTAAYRDVIRAKTVLLLAEDYTLTAVARMVGRQRRIVRKWAWRFLDKRLKGLLDAPRSGRPPRFSPRSRGASDQAGLRAA
jgi:DNA-directed RNA polymerase sigma subunit (sigma70/sigma32)